MFLIYINEIVSNIKSETHLFADDILLLGPISTPRDHEILLENINALIKW